MIEVKIICDSLAPCGKRLTTYLATYPLAIHAQLKTHRDLSTNSCSARAMPIAKVVERCLANPAIPERWRKNGKGMQPKGELPKGDAMLATSLAKNHLLQAVNCVECLEDLGVHKEQANRYLMPFAHITTVISATELGNFFSLRVDDDAQEEHAELAFQMLHLYLHNEPKQLKAGEWHIPFMDRDVYEGLDEWSKLKVATARAARGSYANFYGKFDLEDDYRIHDELKQNGHMSPFEHPAMALDKSIRSGNFVGFQQYRKMIPYENRTPSRDELWEIYNKRKEKKQWSLG